MTDHSPPPKASIERFILLLERTEFWTDEWFDILGQLKQHGYDEIPSMIAAMANPNPSVHRAMEMALFNVGRLGGYDLIHAFKTEDPQVRRRIGNVLGWVIQQDGTPIHDVVNALTESLADEDPMIRSCAATALSQAEASAEPAIPGLIQLLDDADHFVRLAAAEALGSLAPWADDAVPALKRLLNDKNNLVREAAREALNEIDIHPG